MSLIATCLLLVTSGLHQSAAGANETPPARQVDVVRPTLIRVTDEEGKVRAGSRVYVVASPGIVPLRANSAREYRCDDRGRVRIPVGSGAPSWIWAVADTEAGRLASAARTVGDIGRPQRLEMKVFPVGKIRIVGLEAWRKKLPASREFRCAVVQDGPPHVRFDIPLPAGDGHVLELPPLPWANYFPSVVDEHGLLDVRYFSPAFVVDDPPEELYEREVPLKRFVMGEPTEFRCDLVVPAGQDEGVQPVEDGRASLHGGYQGFEIARDLEIDASGRVEFLLPKRGVTRLGWQTMSLHAYVDGHMPGRISYPAFPTADKSVLKLVAGEPSRWDIHGRRADDEIVLMTTAAPIGSWERLVHVVAKGENAPIRLPAMGGPVGSKSHVLLLRDGVLSPIVREVSAKVRVDLDTDLVSVDLRVLRGERPVPHARVEIGLSSGGLVDDALIHVANREGVCRLRLPPGQWYVYAAHPKHGSTFTNFVVRTPANARESRVEHRLVIEPYAEFHGQILLPGDEPAASAELNIVSEFRSIDARPLDRWVRFIDQSRKAGADGRFRLRLPSFVPKWQVYVAHQVGANYYSGSRLFETQSSADPIEFLLTQ